MGNKAGAAAELRISLMTLPRLFTVAAGSFDCGSGWFFVSATIHGSPSLRMTELFSASWSFAKN